LQYPLTDRRNEENVTSLPKPPDMGYSSETMPNMSGGFALGVASLVMMADGGSENYRQRA